jgi:hypothetical protein
MSKKYFLTLPDGLAKYLDEQANTMGVTALEYIQHLIMRDKEEKNTEVLR